MKPHSFFSQHFHSLISRRAAVLLVALAWSRFLLGGDIHDAAAGGDVEKVKALLKGNPDLVFSTNNYGGTPLQTAVIENRKDVVELLLANGAEVNAKDNITYTPLHWAAVMGHKEVAEVLLANKAEVNAKNNYGATPLHLAATPGHKDVVELLLAHGAEVDVYDAAKSGVLEKVKALLKDHPDLVSCNDHKYGRTPLHWAAGGGCKDVAALLPQLIVHGPSAYDHSPSQSVPPVGLTSAEVVAVATCRTPSKPEASCARCRTRRSRGSTGCRDAAGQEAVSLSLMTAISSLANMWCGARGGSRHAVQSSDGVFRSCRASRWPRNPVVISCQPCTIFRSAEKCENMSN